MYHVPATKVSKQQGTIMADDEPTAEEEAAFRKEINKLRKAVQPIFKKYPFRTQFAVTCGVLAFMIADEPEYRQAAIEIIEGVAALEPESEIQIE